MLVASSRLSSHTASNENCICIHVRVKGVVADGSAKNNSKN